MSSDISDMSFEISSLHAAYADGATPQAIVAEVYQRIKTVADPGIFIHLRDETTVTEEVSGLPPFDAKAYPLWGIPFAIKDNIDLAGTPTTAACPAYAYNPENDAFVVAKLKAAKEKRFEKITVLRVKHAAKQAQASKEEETYDLVDKLQYRHHISNPDLDCKNKPKQFLEK